MKVTDSQDHINHAVFTGNQAIDFTFAATPEMFHAFTDGLYSDKPRAVSREILCNAWDAHIVSGKQDIPIEVSTKRELDGRTTYTFRDHGPGIAPEDMPRLYGTIGGTNKIADDNQTGGFGLGCKAPFCLVDHFEVVSRHKGIQTIYRVTKSASEHNGKPGIYPIASLPTKETGVSVSVTTTQLLTNDIMAVIREGGMNARYNDHPVNIWEFEPTPGNYYWMRGPDTHLMVRYGNVVYPITDPDFRELFYPLANLMDSHSFRSYHSRVRSDYVGTLIVQAAPGTISVTPSRESISMTPKTKATLLSLCGQAINELVTEINSKLSTYVDRCADAAMLSVNPYFWVYGDVPKPLGVLSDGAQKGSIENTKIFNEHAVSKTKPNTVKDKILEHNEFDATNRLVKRAIRLIYKFIDSHPELSLDNFWWAEYDNWGESPERFAFRKHMPYFLWGFSPEVVLSHTYYPGTPDKLLYPLLQTKRPQLVYRVNRSPKQLLATRELFKNFPFKVLDKLDDSLLEPKVRTAAAPRVAKPKTFTGLLAASYLVDPQTKQVSLDRSKLPETTAPVVTDPKWFILLRNQHNSETFPDWPEWATRRFIKAFGEETAILRSPKQAKSLDEAGVPQLGAYYDMFSQIGTRFLLEAYIAVYLKHQLGDFSEYLLNTQHIRETLNVQWTEQQRAIISFLLEHPAAEYRYRHNNLEAEWKKKNIKLPAEIAQINISRIRAIRWRAFGLEEWEFFRDILKLCIKEVPKP